MDDSLDPIWRALSDPTRRQVLDLLRDGPLNTGQIAAAFPAVTRFAIMKHLSVLESAGLLLSTKEGRQRFHSINALPLREVYERWVSQFADLWANSLLRLREHAEGFAVKDTRKSTEIQPGIADFQLEQKIGQLRSCPCTQSLAHPTAWLASRAMNDPETYVLEQRMGGWIIRREPDALEQPVGIITRFNPPHEVEFAFGLDRDSELFTNVRIRPRPVQPEGIALHLDCRCLGALTTDRVQRVRTVWERRLKAIAALAEQPPAA